MQTATNKQLQRVKTTIYFRPEKGFSLIELMIVVAVIGILASIAYPAYQEQVQSTRRSDAQTTILQLANLMEHYYTENNTYTGATLANIGGSATSNEGFYTMSITNLTATTYTLNAAPAAGGPQTTDPCGTLTLTHTNIKGPTPNTCW